MNLSRTSFSRDTRGSVAIMFGLSAVVLMVTAGLAVDTARFYNLQSKVQDSLDAAALVAAKAMGEDSVDDDTVIQRARANYQQSLQHLGIPATGVEPLTVQIDRVNMTVDLSSKMVTPSIIGKLAGIGGNAYLNQSSKVVYDINKVELAMVLDITGSMNDKNKIADLKSAANDVIDVLYDDAVAEDTVRIAVAPYAASVNAGSLAATVSSTPTTTTCTSFWFLGKSCQTTTGADIDTCVIERQGAHAATDAAPFGADKLPSVPSTPYGNYSCPTSTVVPMQTKSQSATLKSLIDGYTASGATAGHIGAAWGWYLLSPEWASVLPGSSQPTPYNQAHITKAALIMTDGLFNTSYLSGSSTSASQQIDESYAQFQSLCTGMKAKGIKVYTVGFDLNDPRALNELQSCATDSKTFFDAKTGAELKKAFKDVAKQLSQMRVAS